MKRSLGTLLLAYVMAMPASAGASSDAKLRCQVEFGPRANLIAACEHGVELGAQTPGDIERAEEACVRDTDDQGGAAACRRGARLQARYGGAGPGDENGSFSYDWKHGRGGVKLDAGNYEVHLGDAAKSTEECLRTFEGSSTPPSCLSGITVQHKPSGDVPAR